MVNLESSFAGGAVTLTHWHYMQSDVVYTFQMLFNLQHMPMTDTSCLQLENFAHVPVQSDGLAL
jgi:hypothetical protein